MLCEQLLHRNILCGTSYRSGVSKEVAIRKGFADTEKEILQRSEDEHWKSGTTVVLSIIVNDELWIANTGDSEAVLGKRVEGGRYEAQVLSQKHKPSDVNEKERIKKAGGHVVFGRVMGSLAVARALGDRDFKYPYNKADGHFVSAEPFVDKLNILPEHEFLIISCDGLW
jgi:protein phosphatase 2C family protein 2/3